MTVNVQSEAPTGTARGSPSRRQPHHAMKAPATMSSRSNVRVPMSPVLDGSIIHPARSAPRNGSPPPPKKAESRM